MNRFALGVAWRLVLVVALAWVESYVWLRGYPPLLLLPAGLAHAALFINLYRYVTGVNRKLTRFLESVRYSDFAVSFRSDNALGRTFQGLNEQFNDVLEAFRQARAEKEANLQYLNTIVQHVGVGLLSFDAAGQVELVNQAALRLLGVYRLRTIGELQPTHPQLYALLTATQTTPAPTGPASQLVGVQSATLDSTLSVRCTTVRLRGRLITLVSLQNIRTELQQKELDAWQNLTKVLRHEIMNSVTPLVSLAGTMRQIVDHELTNGHAPPDSVDDLREALSTIENRGRGIMQFVDAYRHFTSIPAPQFADVAVADLLRHVAQLVQPDLQHHHIALELPDNPPLTVRADAGQLEMVLLNLIKNAVESLDRTPLPRIRLDALSEGTRVLIRVSDNGPGIGPDALEQIFIPFYTTKKTGSGIGLSLSRQIMQLHGGQLTVESTPGQGSTFSLVL